MAVGIAMRGKQEKSRTVYTACQRTLPKSPPTRPLPHATTTWATARARALSPVPTSSRFPHYINQDDQPRFYCRNFSQTRSPRRRPSHNTDRKETDQTIQPQPPRCCTSIACTSHPITPPGLSIRHEGPQTRASASRAAIAATSGAVPASTPVPVPTPAEMLVPGGSSPLSSAEPSATPAMESGPAEEPPDTPTPRGYTRSGEF